VATNIHLDHLDILKDFAKDKIPRPDGWTSEFFLSFFDLVCQDLLDCVKDSRVKGNVLNSINSTFIALIPKGNKPNGFMDYRSIALCNMYYKLIAKVIAKRLRLILSRALSYGEIGLPQRKTNSRCHRTTLECLHSIKSKKLQSIILKLDLKKAYDCTDWDYLRLILLQCGFSLPTTNWIMVCVSSTNFAVLINGEPTNFFNCKKGLRQGCLMSPLLFILMMEGLSLALNKAKAEGSLTGLKVSRSLNILLLLFVDDILILSKASLFEWKVIQGILQDFCKASG
jgi:hypothetical protein